jgi:undecaprenyl-diphosphatase
LLAYSVIALLATDLLHVSLDYRDDLQRYQPQIVLQTLTREQWQEQGWRKLPQQRLDFQGQRRQDLTLQWAGTREQLEQRLRDAGWQPAPALDLKGLLLWLSPQVELRELPVLPQLHNGREDELRMVRYDADSASRWLVRFWDVGARLQAGDATIWIGSVSQQQREPRMRLFTLALDDPLTHVPTDLLAPAWGGLHIQQVIGSNPDEPITLIAD